MVNRLRAWRERLLGFLPPNDDVPILAVLIVAAIILTALSYGAVKFFFGGGWCG